MTGSRCFVALAAIVASMFALARQAAGDAPRPVEATLSYQLLQIESTVRPVSKAKFALLRSALERATDAAAAKHYEPRTRRQAIEALDAIQIALSQHNFIQPTARDASGETIGDAFEPLKLSREERKRLLAPGEVNGFRARYVDPAKPLYYVNGAIASQLFISVGQRLGWDIRLVSLPEHYFVRWHLSLSEWINWDWTAGGPSRNTDYSIDGGTLYRDWPARMRELRSLSPAYARAQYLFLVSRRVAGTPEKRRLLELAMTSDPSHELVQNGLAWAYATDPLLGQTHGRRALGYALSAWAANPSDGAIADTVACAFAATGERAVAAQIERFAIERVSEAGDPALPEYRARLRQMEAGGSCTVVPPGARRAN